MRTGTGCAAGLAVRPARETVIARSARPRRRSASRRASSVPPRMRTLCMAFADRLARESAAPHRWLSIVGIGEDGIEGLTATARGLISAAEIVFGGKRHLALAVPLIRGAARAWPSPFDRAVEEVVAQRGRQVCVLASGDPYLYGVGSLLARHVDADETIVVPAPSAFSLAAARLRWPLPDVAQVSLHGRALERIRPHLQPGAKVLALTSDAGGPVALAQLLTASGFGNSKLSVLEAVGGPRERVRTATAAAFDFSDVDPLNLVAIDVAADANARVLARAPGLPDEFYEHDGQLTKKNPRVHALDAGAAAARVVGGHRRRCRVGRH